MGRRGFSLVEVIIVTAIIAIMAAFAVPVFVSAKKQAHVADCASNQRQIGLSLGLYASDNESWAPPYATTTVYSKTAKILGRPVQWRDSLALYAGKNTDIFWCHLDPHRGTNFVADSESVGNRAMVTSFQMAAMLLLPTLFGDQQGNLHLDVDLGSHHPEFTRSPSQTVYLADALWASGQKLPDDTLEMVCGHGARENRLYLDGHVANKPVTAE